MTLKELSQLYWLNREIEAEQKRLDELRARTGAPSSPALTGMPHAPGYNGSKVEREALSVISLEQIIEAKKKRCEVERRRLELYIAGIPDSYLRQIFVYRFINGLTWEQVAACIGGKNTADGVRMACNRYIKQENSEKV